MPNPLASAAQRHGLVQWRRDAAAAEALSTPLTTRLLLWLLVRSGSTQCDSGVAKQHRGLLTWHHGDFEDVCAWRSSMQRPR